MGSATIASNSIVPEVLDQHNYADWSARVEIYLLAEDLWEVVNKEPPKPEEGEAEYKAWMKKNVKALHAISISCGTQLFPFIRETRTAKIAWEVLEKKCKPDYILLLEKRERNKSLHTQVNDATEELMTAGKGGKGGIQSSSNHDFDSSYQPFFDSVENGDWNSAKEHLDALPLPINALRAKNPADRGCTALHVAAWEGHAHIVKDLVLVMSQENLEIRNDYGHTALHLAVINAKVEVVKELVSFMREEGLEIKNNMGGTALHTAAQKGHVNIVKELVPRIREEALEIKNGQGYTALAVIINADKYSEGDMIEVIKPMVAKNPKILGIDGPPYDFIPLVMASSWSKFQVARYLYSLTPLEALKPRQNGRQGAQLIRYCLGAKVFDIPRHLLSIYPELATVKGNVISPLVKLSRVHSGFLSGMRLKFWQKWIYDCISIQAPSISNIHDVSIAVSNLEDDGSTHRDLNISAASLFKRFIECLHEVLGIKRIYENKSIHIQMLELIDSMGEATSVGGDHTIVQHNFIQQSIFEAIERGDLEFVIHICKANPHLVNIHDGKGRSIFHFAIECRQEEIYSLIYGLQEEKRSQFASSAANFNFGMLDGVGKLSPFAQSNRIQVATLQMQRELQWFKEVASLVPTAYHDSKNESDYLTSRELFHKSHEKLMVEAETSIKGIASSCTIVGALIVTVMFATAFTIPGGNNNTTGLPIFKGQNLFFMFIASDTISLVFSTTSVIIFLGILTSRYSAEDFLINLPTKMMIGLFTLFIAITTMMIAFSCELYIMLHEECSWVAIPSILVASIPVASFMWMLFPLLIQTFISTYGPGIFNKKVKPWL